MYTRLPLLLACLPLLAACPPDSDREMPACTVDCSPDAGPPADAPPAPDGASEPGDDIVNADLVTAAVTDGLTRAGERVITDAEMAEDGAVSFEEMTGAVGADSAAAAVETLPGRVTYVLVRWGFLPPLVPHLNEWHDFSGYLAVTDGCVEVLRALRWEGGIMPDMPRPHVDGVAPQEESCIVRFRSTIGSGTDGLLVRIVRPAVEPSSFVLRIGGTTHIEALDAHMLTRATSGGWTLAEGNVEIDSYVTRTTQGDTMSGQVTGFSFAVVAPAPTEVVTDLSEREWFLSEFDVGGDDIILDHGIRTGEALSRTVSYGHDLPFDVGPPRDDPRAQLAAFVNENGKTYLYPRCPPCQRSSRRWLRSRRAMRSSSCGATW